MASRKNKQQEAEAAEQYRVNLYWWLHDLWERVKNRPNNQVQEAVAKRCDDLFDDLDELADGARENTTVEQLEGIRVSLMVGLWLGRDDYAGIVNGWPWRTTPPTHADATMALSDQMASTQDVLVLDATRGGGAISVRTVDCSATAGRVRVVAGETREQVLADLLDIVRAIQTDWDTLVKAEICVSTGHPNEDEAAERAKWAKLAPIAMVKSSAAA